MCAPSNRRTTAPLSRIALFYMALQAVQFGFQPFLTRTYARPATCRSSVVIVQECLKFCLAFLMLNLSGGRKSALQGWSVMSWLSVAGIPAALYSVQNLASLQAYQNLDSLTFNVLNQTKTLSAALCCYLVMGRGQSKMQVVALLLLLVSALVIEKIVTVDVLLGHDKISIQNMDGKHLTQGVMPVLLASFISGLAGALCQKNLQGTGGRNPYLFSMELCAASTMILLASLPVSPDGQRIRENGFWHGWTPSTLIPILTNSIGGILVGLVTKYAGSVRKGFAIIFGMFLSGLVQAPSTGVSTAQIMGGGLAAMSLWLHASNPPTKTTKKA